HTLHKHTHLSKTHTLHKHRPLTKTQTSQTYTHFTNIHTLHNHTHCACTPVDTAVSLATGLAWRRACHVTGAGCVSCFWRAPGGKIDWPLIWLLRAGEERNRAPLHCHIRR